jgi:hypothetical protein
MDPAQYWRGKSQNGTVFMLVSGLTYLRIPNLLMFGRKTFDKLSWFFLIISSRNWMHPAQYWRGKPQNGIVFMLVSGLTYLRIPKLLMFGRNTFDKLTFD